MVAVLMFQLLIVPDLRAIRPSADQESQQQARPNYVSSPFLYPPYPGSTGENSIFDHNKPEGDPDNNIIMTTWDGHEGECDGDGEGGCDSPTLNFNVGYDGHSGIDFNVDYDPILTAADSTQVIYAGWSDPQNHSRDYGLHIRLLHSNSYLTLYGHLSAVALPLCTGPGGANCTNPYSVNLDAGDLIGIGGNSGHSSGAHLHFEVLTQDILGVYHPIDPYGWFPDEQSEVRIDPWQLNQPESLWIVEPDITRDDNANSTVLPLGIGNALPFPPGPTNDCEDNQSGCVDDDAGVASPYFERAQGCVIRYRNTVSAVYDMFWALTVNDPSSSPPDPCWARWHWPYNDASASGTYKVYINIPKWRNPDPNATYPQLSETAIYTLYKDNNGTLFKKAEIIINQEDVIDNVNYSSGWIYVGTYEFIYEPSTTSPSRIIM